PLITFPYVSRVLGPEGYGRVGFATSLISYFAMFAKLGIPTYGIRACARVRDDREALSRTVHELMTINLVMSAVTYAAFFACIFLVPSLADDRSLYIIMSVTIFLGAIEMEWLYKGLEMYTYITVRSLIFKLIALIAMFLLVRSSGDYVIYGAISVFAVSASGICNFLHSGKYITMHPVGKYHFMRHMRAVGIFFAMACATTVYTHLDVVMLGLMTTKTDVGYYNAAVRIKSILVSIVTSLGAVLLPRASYYIEKGRTDEFERISRKALNFVFVMALPMTVYFMLFAGEGIGFLSGAAYAPSVLPMQIIMPTLLFIGITNIFGIQILVPLGREKDVLYSEIAGAVVDFALNMLLIPRLGAAGAAIGTLAAEGVVLMWQAAVLREKMRDLVTGIRVKTAVPAILLAVLASVWVKAAFASDTALGCFIALAVSAALFFGVYAGTLLLMRDPMAWEIFGSVVGLVRRRKR
ncbi:MAG: flippase, partial [Lachnospiraceae bacterium]|nr:flippase [Lachnospiraceae bacterium]